MSRRYPRPAVPAATIADEAHRAMASLAVPMPAPFVSPDEQVFRNAPTSEEPAMKLQFTSVTLLKTMPRITGEMGQATQDTTFFDAAKAGVAVELDTSTQLVRIAKGYDARYVPLAGVERFGPTLDDAAKHADAKAKAAAEAAAKAEAATPSA